MATPPGELAFDSRTVRFLPLCLLALQMDCVTASLQYTKPCNTQICSFLETRRPYDVCCNHYQHTLCFAGTCIISGPFPRVYFCEPTVSGLNHTYTSCPSSRIGEIQPLLCSLLLRFSKDGCFWYAPTVSCGCLTSNTASPNGWSR